jgi:hypothetical protein
MKRILISILCGTALVFGYYFFLIILYQVYPVSFATLATLLLPINVPYNIYKSIFGFYYGNPTVLKVLDFAVAILLYSIPFYLVLTFFAKMKKKSKVQGIENPPEPPIFES